jgi:hypothetical protein
MKKSSEGSEVGSSVFGSWCWGCEAGSCLVYSDVSETCTASIFRVTGSGSGGC